MLMMKEPEGHMKNSQSHQGPHGESPELKLVPGSNQEHIGRLQEKVP